MHSRLAGLYVITPAEPDTRALVERVGQALAGGARTVQYRNKSAAPALAMAQLRALRALTRDAGARLIVNDSVDLALAVDADGVHLGAADGDLTQARTRLGPTRLLGASCYDRLELAQAAVRAGADHVAFGSVFASTTKPAARRAPLELFTRARGDALLTHTPLCAIGGIDAHNAHAVIDAGADVLAVISAVFDATDITVAARAIASQFPDA
jgi:thiamine-phosphate pyrophosphorylase